MTSTRSNKTFPPGNPEAAHQALESKIRELEMANRELETFASCVAHDLRAPLRFISKFAYLLLSEHAEALSPEALNYASLIQAGTKQMSALIEDLLHFSRTMKEPLNKRHFSLDRLAEEVAAAHGRGWGDREVRIAVQDLGTAEADPDLLRLVLDNLIGNAVKFTAGRPCAEIVLAVDRDSERMPVYSVQDNGVGFPPGMAEEIFVIFRRCHAPEDFEGTGVGLALVKKIVERHGGRIWAEGRPGEGATVHFTLEADTAPEVKAVLDAMEGDGHAG